MRLWPSRSRSALVGSGRAVLDRANRVVKQVAEAEKYDVILQEAVYLNPQLDITDKVIKALNASK